MPAIYLFGSRVRGDHRPDSDVDLCLFQAEWDGSDACTSWWGRTSDLEYRDLADLLPGPPRLHLETWDAALRWVDEARVDPSRIVLQVRKAVCLWTAPKHARKP
ncbi:nucleotidyltransferase domain-containing protein [Lichenibacterium dinghuense]|uniref:nucleotidyltransferase domain-containing protein n=1 Tax=Lichenibacterium dinghuense TaxID=2895977 RepID=UPI001F21C751|nr:nucleotidyltransferase domain-containing protein [Lichenibacterium sp. 6Y81]